MLKCLARCAVVACALLPSAAGAEPIKLKAAFFSSDRSMLYRAAVKPFADAVNAEGSGVVEIEVSFSGALGKNLAQQVQLLLDGTADIAFVVPGYTPERFADTAVLELPGMFRNSREASLVFTRLIADKVLTGYEGFVVIGAFAGEPETIHTRPPTASLGDLRGKNIRVNNTLQGSALEKLGIAPVLMPVNQVSDAMIAGKIDGAAVPPAMLFEFGIGRAASYHFALPTTSAPLTLLMDRKKFESLPAAAQRMIRSHGGEWAATRFFQLFGAVNAESEEKLSSDPRRKVIEPSQSDRDAAAAAYDAVIAEWTEKNPRHRDLLRSVKAELAKIRSQ
jgi:TRAP-type C4-dicarboxylate transport system substrate-binding protein